jgi:signal transduction histidine kinase
VTFSNEILRIAKPLVVHSTERQLERDGLLLELADGLDVPAASIPLVKLHRQIGLLTLYGRAKGQLPDRYDTMFLRLLGSVITDAMDRWHWRFQLSAFAEMDTLFRCDSLEEVATRAAAILKRYLSAAGCMVVYRPDPIESEMHIVAEAGFNQRVYKCGYRAGIGQTGLCAQTGQPIRWDDVPLHREMFDTVLLETLEKAHGHSIRSWLAIPIGPADANHGVIKVVNRTTRSTWFNDQDQELGMSLALKLKVIIERFVQVKEILVATEEAHRQSDLANQQTKAAEEIAKQRQDDLMAITHQLQGPLASVIGSVSYMMNQHLPKHLLEDLESIRDTVEDCLTLCYGTYTTFARARGRESHFFAAPINAPQALKRLCERLQKTNARNDLTFRFREAPNFPFLIIDHNVFISVFYSLIHNAMKYADKHSEVVLECSFERSTGEAALKVKSIGEPIHPRESDLIFEKFKRGGVIEKTGRHHSGVGLGLWVARDLMRAVGGDLTVELSPKEPRLSVFVIHVPKPLNTYER